MLLASGRVPLLGLTVLLPTALLLLLLLLLLLPKPDASATASAPLVDVALSVKGESNGPRVGLDATTVLVALPPSSVDVGRSKGWAGDEVEATAKSDADESTLLCLLCTGDGKYADEGAFSNGDGPDRTGALP
jgi:hypothetical protein